MQAASAAAQDPATPPCAPGVAPSATLRGTDVEDNGGPLTATHTIALSLDTSEGEVEDFEVALPPGAQGVTSGPSPAFRSDALGPIPVRGTWLYFPPGSSSACRASTETVFGLAAASRIRYSAPRRRAGQMSELNWRLRYGENADLRPIVVRLRGTRRARLPSRSAPAQTLIYGLRRGDPGFRVTGTGRRLRSAGWRFHFDVLYEREIRIRMHGFKRGGPKGFGFDLDFVQAGRLIGRTRAVGRCRFSSLGSICSYRTR